MMKTIFYLIATFFLGQILSSCATILHNKTYYLEVRSNERNAEIQVYDTVYTLPTMVEVTRSKESFSITLKTDSLKLDFAVRPALNTAFKYANLPMPIGYLVDLTNDKRYYYGKSVFLNSKDTTRIIIPTLKKQTLKRGEEKGNFYLDISVPHINVFSLAPEGERRYTNAGFWGIGLGFDYYYNSNKFISLYGAAITDFFVPVPAAVDIEGDWELMTSTYVSLSHNHRIGDFSLGYGVSLSKNTWDFRDDRDYYPYTETADEMPEEPFPGYDFEDESRKKSSIALGFVFPLAINMGNTLTFGITYRPSFYRPQLERKFRYEATLSFSLGCKIGLIKKKRNSPKL